MQSKGKNPLKKALRLIRAGKSKKARSILVDFLRGEPNNPQAWFLLSYALDDPQRQQYALLQALRVDPQFERARARLQILRGEPGQIPSERTPAFISQSDSPRKKENLRKAAKPEKAASAKGNRGLLFLLLIILVAVSAVLGMNLLRGGLGEANPTATEAIAFRTLPPTWTTTPELGANASSEVFPAATAIELAQLPAEVLAQMENIQDEVSTLRGLEFQTQVQNAIVDADQASLILGNLYLGSEAAQSLLNHERTLGALGLISADYYLTDYALSSHADHLGAFYVPAETRLYLVGDNFAELMPFIYSHVVGHTLINQNFEVQALQAEECLPFSDACRSMLAFVEGQSTLLSRQWLNAYASAAIFQDAEAYNPDPLLIQAQTPPDFALLDLAFPYEQGFDFAQTVYDEGGWEQINSVYDNPPASSEQILHAEKFFAGEVPKEVDDPALGDALGAEWSLTDSGSLGEWLTYLLLAHGADANTRLAETAALDAAAGWGGDQFQAYVHAGDGDVAIAVHWVMDSQAQAVQLSQSLQQHLALRFSGGENTLGSGQCWQGEGRRACLFEADDELLILLGPDDAALLQAMLDQYSQFQ